MMCVYMSLHSTCTFSLRVQQTTCQPQYNVNKKAFSFQFFFCRSEYENTYTATKKDLLMVKVNIYLTFVGYKFNSYLLYFLFLHIEYVFQRPIK